MFLGTMLVAARVFSFRPGSGISRPSFSMRSYSGVFGSAVSSPIAADWMPASVMNWYCSSKVAGVVVEADDEPPARRCHSHKCGAPR
jgi:hypothetical protein